MSGILPCPQCQTPIQVPPAGMPPGATCPSCGGALPVQPLQPTHVPGVTYAQVPCPKCGSDSNRSGSWPWYLGTIGAFICTPVICNQCNHAFDAKAPQSDLDKRKRNLAIAINGFGLAGIVAVIGLVSWYAWMLMK